MATEAGRVEERGGCGYGAAGDGEATGCAERGA